MTRLPTLSSILCLFQGESSELGALDMAFGLTCRFGAVLRVLHISTPPMQIIDPFGASAYVGAFVSEGLIDSLVKDENTLIAAARNYVQEHAAAYELPFCRDEHHVAITVGPRVVFDVEEGYTGRLVRHYSQQSDIVVARREEPSRLNDESRVLPALFDTGKGVVLVPGTPIEPPRPGGDFKTIAMAWDGSRQASRALKNALPLMFGVKNLYLITVKETGHSTKTPWVDPVVLLQPYGIVPIPFELEDTQGSVARCLLDAATDLNADLLVLGAFGHSRISEMLLGGTSHYILKHAALPVFMSH
jgi:nucleotide-binding universal stress UspA family protein